ncbi:MAG TPA: hypothetical protein PKM97_09545 [Bacteroidia bacterium]|nr:hypothetical protein [Bacteroidia bacterium]
MLLHESCVKFFFLALGMLFMSCTESNAQNDLPSPTANMQTITTGSVVIPMDNLMQSYGGYFNLKAYGLVNYLLQNNIPVKWAIRAGKGKDAIDFSTNAQRVKPSVQFPNWFDFRCGPFIVDSAYANAAKSLATTFANNVNVYQLTSNVNVDIRYTLDFKPKIGICSNGSDQSIHIDALTAAGIYNTSWVTVIPASQVVPYCGYTIVSELHWNATSDTSKTFPVYRYVKNGGNFFAQCLSIQAYENMDTLHTTRGIDIQSGSTMSYHNADLPIMQFDGALSNPGGALEYWSRKTSGIFRATTYTGVQTSGSPTYQFMNGAKVLPNNVAGGNVFYLGGHDYDNTSSNGEINGRRIYLNAVFIPPKPSAWCSTLPVKLLYFHAIPNGETVNLRWATASELNNDHFLIERSKDGLEFFPFKVVQGSGTVNSVSYYSTEDLSPMRGKSYYRLSQIDYDGTQEAFEPIMIKLGELESKYRIFPNPAVDGITIQLGKEPESEMIIELTDIYSQIYISERITLEPFQTEYYWEFPGSVSAGIYTLKISDRYDNGCFKLLVNPRKP